MEISRGVKEDGIVIGNAYDKYNTGNPIARLLMRQFELCLKSAVERIAPASINEIGCGEGYWVLYWKELFGKDFPSTGSDFSAQVIEIAVRNARQREIDPGIFQIRSIYDLTVEADSADLLVCCEVMEHLENPAAALAKLREITRKYLIVSVPNEPLWCFLNLMRLKYVASGGNTPGHIQHWSRKKFIELVSGYFTVEEVHSPLPFTLLVCKK